MSKIVYISSIAAPHQIRLCQALNKYMDAHFLFYEYLDAERAQWWKIPLCKKCHFIKNLLFKRNGRYLTFDVLKQLKELNPDIVMLGGFSIPANYLAYRWAKKNKKKTLIFTELSRDKHGVLRPFNLTWKLQKFFYRDVDYILTSHLDATRQFRDDFQFGSKVITSRYATDLDGHLQHPLREKKEAYTYLFPNRLTNIYNPLLAIDIFAEVYERYPKSKLLLNNEGELKDECIEKIKHYQLEESIEFLSEIKAWDDLPKVYERSDILIFPALFSNGNFSINESMASGMGIIISNKINGHSNTLSHKKNCFIIEPDKDEFIGAIEAYIAQPELFKIHARMNKKLMEPLSVEGTAKFLYESLKELKVTT
ncbi:MAG: Group 1 glycosyl transferase [uncultured Sulfurovum sp.]|uniref:Group 1 glycosyl transferase n=1 Tax=uncultured Sulfurovum sp. TaxID=269237 RepID=A0A6S6SSK4_9BACT|nr:MAG: Group 1 glycosyl transferase [uncultured Sulfurovum sp.]